MTMYCPSQSTPQYNVRDDLVWWRIEPDIDSGFVINGFNNVAPATEKFLTTKSGVAIEYHYWLDEVEFSGKLDYFFPQSAAFTDVSDVQPSDIGLINVWNQYEDYDGIGSYEYVEMGYLIPTDKMASRIGHNA